MAHIGLDAISDK